MSDPGWLVVIFLASFIVTTLIIAAIREFF